MIKVKFNNATINFIYISKTGEETSIGKLERPAGKNKFDLLKNLLIEGKEYDTISFLEFYAAMRGIKLSNKYMVSVCLEHIEKWSKHLEFNTEFLEEVKK